MLKWSNKYVYNKSEKSKSNYGEMRFFQKTVSSSILGAWAKAARGLPGSACPAASFDPPLRTQPPPAAPPGKVPR